MQVFANVATKPERKITKASGRAYYEFRACESQRGVDTDPTWYTVRVMKDADPRLVPGDFVKVTGKLRVDCYLSRQGKPAATLLVIAFEAQKIAKPSVQFSENLHPEREPQRHSPVTQLAADRSLAELYEA
jgi:single-stranded DNA-binding protein